MNKSEFCFDTRLDGAFLEDTYEGDLEHAQIIFEQYIELTPVQMKEIEEAYHTGEVESFRQKVHKIKPIFSFVGLTSLTSQADILEKKCKDINNINEIDGLYNELKNSYTAFLPVIENEFTRLKDNLN